MFHWGFISFLPLREQSERKGLPLPSQEGGERTHPSPTLERAALAQRELTRTVSVRGSMQVATWHFLQDLVVEIDGSFVILFSKHQVSHHLSENT